MGLVFGASFFQSDAFAVILSVGIVVLAVAMTVTVLKVISIERNVAKSRCRILGVVDINPDDVDNPHVIITIANRTLHHINIISCGIFYDKKMINFIDKIRSSNELEARDKVFIPTNDSIEVKIPIAKVRELVEGGKGIAKVRVYAQDSLNHLTKVNATGVKKYILEQRKKERLALKAAGQEVAAIVGEKSAEVSKTDSIEKPSVDIEE